MVRRQYARLSDDLSALSAFSAMLPVGAPDAQSGDARSIRLTGGGASCSRARSFVRTSLAAIGWEGDVEAAVLLASELVANASLHGGGECRLTLRIANRRLRIEALDSSAHLPVLRHPADLEEGGRGLLLVDVLALDWGAAVLEGHGKVVWFEL